MKIHRRPWSFVAVLALLMAGVLLVAGCGAAGPARSLVAGTGIAITATAGPVCPVERVPPDPACAPRPVPDATILVVDGQGKTVVTVTTGADGTVLVAVPAGAYVLQPLAVPGMMGGAQPVNVTVMDGAVTPAAVSYDTGIR
jgi:hypothetical protein